jgi:uncharacterized protein
MNNSFEPPESLLSRYNRVTKAALLMAQQAPVRDAKATAIVLDMASRYVSDADYFLTNGDPERALAALSYAHGWLDCAARLELFIVNDNTLFTVDEKEQ